MNRGDAVRIRAGRKNCIGVLAGNDEIGSELLCC